MDTGLNHIRQSVIPNLERPGGGPNGKGVKLSDSEKKVFLESRSDMVNYPMFFGAVALGANYIVTYPLIRSRARWARLPLNIMAFGFGITYGFNTALEKLIVNLYSLPDSKIAQEGRALLQQKNPTHPVLKAIENKMAANKLAIVGRATGTWKEENMFSGDSSTGSTSSFDMPSTLAADPIPESINNNLVGFGEAIKGGNVAKPLQVASTKSQSSAPIGKNTIKQNPQSEQFHGEDAFSFGGNSLVEAPKADDGKAVPQNKMSTQRTWDDVRAEYQRKHSRS
jgi:hypothetical protein